MYLQRVVRGTFKCTWSGCDRQCTSAHGLEAHQATHTGAKPHTGDICGKGFSDRSNMHRHVALKHGPTGVKKILS